MALSAAQHARKDRILTQPHPARTGNTASSKMTRKALVLSKRFKVRRNMKSAAMIQQI